jgi:hypothetical protein
MDFGIAEDMACLSHPIIKENKTTRDRRVEVLAATEAVFVDDMRKFSIHFLKPLKEAVAEDGSPLINVENFCTNFESHQAVHERFSAEMDSRIAQWVKGGEMIGDVLLKFSQSLMRTLLKFNFEYELSLLNKTRMEHANAKQIDSLIRSAEKSCGESFINLILQLSQRVSAYVFILNEVVLHTPGQHPDRGNLVVALQNYKDMEAIGMAPEEGSSPGHRSTTLRSSSSSKLPRAERKTSASGLNSPRASSGTLRHRLQNSLSTSFMKVGDGLRKRSGTDGSVPMANAGSPRSAGTAAVTELIESISISDSLKKLFNPEGCGDDFENVFLGLHQYFMSWNMFVTQLARHAKEVEGLEQPEKGKKVNRIIQVVTKWLRTNPHLRSEKIRRADAEAELQQFAKQQQEQLKQQRSSSSAAEEDPSAKSPRSPRSPITPRSPPMLGSPSLSKSTAVVEEGIVNPKGSKYRTTNSVTSPRAIELLSGSEDDSSDDVEEGGTSGSESSIIDSPNLNRSGTLTRSQRNIVIGSRRRASVFLETEDTTQTISGSTNIADLDKHLGASSGGGSDSSEGGAPVLRAGGGGSEEFVFFVMVMDEWIRSLPVSEFGPLVKYWDSWRFPKKTRGVRHNSVYYRNLQKSKAEHDPDEEVADILSFESEALAKQMCLQELNTFKCIPRKELCKRNFLEAETGPRFQFMVCQFNIWCGWVADTVLKPNQPQDRANVISKMIEIADICHSWSNFNSSYAIVAGLTHPQVGRLRQTWELVGRNAMKQYNKLLDDFNVSGNYRGYREMLKQVSPPCVPYLGLLGKDLFSIEENSKTLLSEEKGVETVVNFKKLSLIWSALSFVENLQQYEYPDLIEDKKCAAYLAGIKTVVDEAAVKARSHEVEPRASKSSSGPVAVATAAAAAASPSGE